LNNIINVSGIGFFAKYLNKQSKISLQKVIKALQKEYSPEQWLEIKKYHKGASSRKSSNVEDNKHMRATSPCSIRSKKSVFSHEEMKKPQSNSKLRD